MTMSLPVGAILTTASAASSSRRGARDDVLGFASLDVSLPLDDLAREDDIFEVED